MCIALTPFGHTTSVAVMLDSFADFGFIIIMNLQSYTVRKNST
jgi:hypothetical protein